MLIAADALDTSDSQKGWFIVRGCLIAKEIDICRSDVGKASVELVVDLHACSGVSHIDLGWKLRPATGIAISE